jgi:hypothetical protein
MDMNLTQRTFILTILAIALAIAFSTDKVSAQYEYGTLLLNDYNSSNNKCSYDFSTKTFGSVQDGEFYFLKGKLWANNIGQQGLMDLGSVQFDPRITNISSSGFSNFGVTARSRDVYLTKARAGKDDRYILFYIDYVNPIQNGQLMALEYYILETGRIIARTNELGGFNIYGPRLFSSKGKWLQVDRTLTGEYTIVYNDIPGFVTPPSQTKTLGKGKTIVFEGLYQPIQKT